MKMIYISHPYTGDEESNTKQAELTTAALAAEFPDIVFINPLAAMRHAEIAGLKYDTVLGQCIELMRRCNSVIMTGDWIKSRGCREEFKRASDIGMQIWGSADDFRSRMRLEKETSRQTRTRVMQFFCDTKPVGGICLTIGK